jgi:hypothetical protein
MATDAPDLSPADVPRVTAPGGTALAFAMIFLSEAAASLLMVLGRRPVSGLLVMALGLLIALDWVRRFRRRTEAFAATQLASATVLLALGRREAAWNAAAAAADAATKRSRRDAARAIMVDAAIADRDYETARKVVAGMAKPVDPLLEAKIEVAAGQPSRAIAVLEQARGRANFGGDAARRLIELYGEIDDLKRAVIVAIAHFDLLDVEDVRNMVASLEVWGEPAGAALLAGALAARPAGVAREIRIARAPEPER